MIGKITQEFDHHATIQLPSDCRLQAPCWGAHRTHFSAHGHGAVPRGKWRRSFGRAAHAAALISKPPASRGFTASGQALLLGVGSRSRIAWLGPRSLFAGRDSSLQAQS